MGVHLTPVTMVMEQSPTAERFASLRGRARQQAPRSRPSRPARGAAAAALTKRSAARGTQPPTSLPPLASPRARPARRSRSTWLQPTHLDRRQRTRGDRLVGRASFLAAPSTQNITFTATAMSGTTLDALKSQLTAERIGLGRLGVFDNQLRRECEQSRLLSFDIGTGISPGRPEPMALRRERLDLVRCDRSDVRWHIREFHGDRFQRLRRDGARAGHARPALGGRVSDARVRL